MAIIRSAIARQTALSAQREFRLSEVPFVPARDLFELQQAQPSLEEVASVALALYSLASDTTDALLTSWATQARLDSVGQRL